MVFVFAPTTLGGQPDSLKDLPSLAETVFDSGTSSEYEETTIEPLPTPLHQVN